MHAYSYSCSAQMESTPSDQDRRIAVIYSSGLVMWWYAVGQSGTHCRMDITWFPLDVQNCPLIYESWSMSSTQLNITRLKPAVDLSHYQSSGEWHLIGNYVAFTFTFSISIHKSQNSLLTFLAAFTSLVLKLSFSRSLSTAILHSVSLSFSSKH